MLKRLILPAALLALTGVALAQQPAQNTAPAASSSKAAPQQLTPQQQAALAQLKQKLAANAQQVAVQIDQGKYGEVWDGFSPVAKQTVQRDAFTKAIGADRARLGSMTSRKLAFVRLSGSTGSAQPGQTGPVLPKGLYGNVFFATQFSSEKQPVTELVSFHFDSDKVWRPTGYTLRVNTAARAAPPSR